MGIARTSDDDPLKSEWATHSCVVPAVAMPIQHKARHFEWARLWTSLSITNNQSSVFVPSSPGVCQVNLSGAWPRAIRGYFPVVGLYHFAATGPVNRLRSNQCLLTRAKPKATCS